MQALTNLHFWLDRQLCKSYRNVRILLFAFSIFQLVLLYQYDSQVLHLHDIVIVTLIGLLSLINHKYGAWYFGFLGAFTQGILSVTIDILFVTSTGMVLICSTTAVTAFYLAVRDFLR